MDVNPVDVSSEYDSLFWGVMVSVAMFGVNFILGCIYINGNNDGWILRSLVVSLIALDFVTSILSTATVRHFFVLNFGDINVFKSIPNFYIAELTVTSVAVFIVQIFFASRVYLIRRSNVIIPVLIFLAALGSFAASMVMSVDLFSHDVDQTFPTHRLELELGFSAGFSALADIMTTVALSWTFAVTRTINIRTNNVLKALLKYTITRGVLVTLMQIVLVVLYIVEQNKFNATALQFCLGKLYVATMVSMLNSRESLRQHLGGITVTETMMTTVDSTPSESMVMSRPVVSVVQSPRGDDPDIELNTFKE